MTALSQLVKQGKLAKLEVVNIEADSEIAQQLNIRSVPWFRINDLEFEGAYSPSEIQHWVDKAGQDEGIRDYLAEKLQQGKLPQASQLINQHPHWLSLLLPILQDEDAPMQVKVGLGALIEERQGQAELQSLGPQLREMLNSCNPNLRIDALHYLTLLQDRELLPLFQQLRDDDEPEVREIATAAVDEFGG